MGMGNIVEYVFGKTCSAIPMRVRVHSMSLADCRNRGETGQYFVNMVVSGMRPEEDPIAFCRHDRHMLERQIRGSYICLTAALESGSHQVDMSTNAENAAEAIKYEIRTRERATLCKRQWNEVVCKTLKCLP